MSTHPDRRSLDHAASEPAAAPVAPETLPSAPAAQRHDGWTPARQAAFLRELAASHNVAAAARAVGMSRQSAYQLRVRLHGKPFAKAWEAAFHTRFDALAEAALGRALHGVEVPHYYNGELVGVSRRYDERLTLALLAMRRQFVRPPRDDYDPAGAFDADDLPNLIERVERGPQDWLDGYDDEMDAFYGGTYEA
ncbi:MAG: hypothetical protein B7X57_06275 [Erythrobacter sp. 34-65-8]|nr:MAG: hypothetical protein B7X57_06275 [Erythrobacter sp. 34-65-8]